MRYVHIRKKSTIGKMFEHASSVEFMYLAFTCMPGESYPRWLRSWLLCLCDVFQALIDFFVDSSLIRKKDRREGNLLTQNDSSLLTIQASC